MPGLVPARPIAGAVIDTVWGDETHDRTYLPSGIVSSGAGLVGVTAIVALQLDTTIAGNVAFADYASNRVKVPVGLSGLYLLSGGVAVANTLSWCRVTWSINGTNVGVGASVRGIGATPTWLGMPAVLWPLVDGDRVSLLGQVDATDNGDLTVSRLSIVRIGDAFG